MANAELKYRQEIEEDPNYTGTESGVGSGVQTCPYAEGPEPKRLLSVHFEDESGQIVEGVTATEQLEVVIKSENMEGEEVIVDLGDSLKGMKLDGQTIEEEQVIKVEIDGPLVKIPIETVAVRHEDADEVATVVASDDGEAAPTVEFKGVGYFRLSGNYTGDFGFDWMRVKKAGDALDYEDIMGFYATNSDNRVPIGDAEVRATHFDDLKKTYGTFETKIHSKEMTDYVIPHLTLLKGRSCALDIFIEIEGVDADSLTLESSTDSICLSECEIAKVEVGKYSKRATVTLTADENEGFSGKQEVRIIATHAGSDREVIGKMIVHGNDAVKEKTFNVILVQVADGDLTSLKAALTQATLDKWCNKEGYNQVYMDIDVKIHELDLSEDDDFKDKFVKKVYRGTDTGDKKVVDGKRLRIFSGLTAIAGTTFVYPDAVPIRSYAADQMTDMEAGDMDFYIFNKKCYTVEKVLIEDDPDDAWVYLRNSATLNGKAEKIGEGKIVIGFSTGLKKSTFVHEGLHNLGLVHTFQQPIEGHVATKFQYEKMKTDNLLDYASAGSDNRVSLFKWQWELLGAV